MIVSKQSLNALANLAFVELKIKEDGDTKAKAEFSLEGGGAGEAFYHYRGMANAPQSERDYFDAFAVGMEFGLALAAAIVSNAFDLEATGNAFEHELQLISKYWPKRKLRKGAAA